MAGFFAGEAPCISLEKQTLHLQRAPARLFYQTATRRTVDSPAGWQAPPRRAAPGPAEPRRARSGTAARTLPACLSPSPVALRSAAERHSQAPPAVADRSSGPAAAPTGQAGAAAARGGGNLGRPRAPTRVDERAGKPSPGVAPRLCPLRTFEGLLPRCGSPLPPRVPPPQGSSPGVAPLHPPALFPLLQTKPRSPQLPAVWPHLYHPVGPWGESRRAPAIPPHPIAEAPRGQTQAGKTSAPPCRAFPRRAGIRKEEKHIYRIGIFFSLNSTSS